MDFNELPKFCCRQILEYFCHSKKKCVHCQSLCSLHPYLLSYTWNHIIHGVSGLTSFTWHDVFKVQPVVTWVRTSYLYYQIVFHCVDMLYGYVCTCYMSFHPLMNMWVIFSFFAIMRNAVINLCINLCANIGFLFLWVDT